MDDPQPSARRLTKPRFEIEIYNDSATDSLRCGFSVNLSTISTNSNYGREVRPKTGVSWKVPDSVPVHCAVEGSGVGATVTAIAIITQL